MALLCYAAKFEPFLSLDCAPTLVFDRNLALADIGRKISAEILAEIISAGYSCFGYLAETAISAEITLFRPKLTCFGHNILNSREYY